MSRRVSCVCHLAMSYGFSVTLEHASRVSILRFDIAVYGNQNAALRRATQCLKVAVMSGFVLHNCAREAPASRSSSQLPSKDPPPLKGAMRLPVEQCSHLA